jgi:hypothetical protein
VKRNPEYCKSCKIFIDDKCQAEYKNPTSTVEKAMAQAEKKGEWPCSFAPHRAKFIESYRPGWGVRVVKEGN